MRAERHKIVDLPVEYSPEGLALVRERLMPPPDVDDAQAACAEAYSAARLEKEPFVVRSAVEHGRVHRLQHATIGGLSRPADTAHVRRAPLRAQCRAPRPARYLGDPPIRERATAEKRPRTRRR